MPFPASYHAVTEAVDQSAAVRSYFGDALVDALVQVRNLNESTYKDKSAEELAWLFRNLW